MLVKNKLMSYNNRMKKDVKVLAIESSCDETSCSVVENGRKCLSNVVSSQIDIHTRFGGVVPEVASRNHITAIDNVVALALKQANCSLENIDVLAVTYGAGLIGSLLVGVSYAKGLSYATKKPLVAVNHIYGHIAGNYLTYPDLEPPFVCLLVSGGHTAIIKVEDYNHHEVIGTTLDDAVGECFDKVARECNLEYPGGPNVQKQAKLGEVNMKFTGMWKEKIKDFNFSYSGLKTAVINYIHNEKQRGNELNIPNICASFQDEAVGQVVSKSIYALKQLGYDKIVLAGGVSANELLRQKMDEEASKIDAKVFYPPIKLCTDNAAMIASAGYYSFINNKSIVDPKTLVPTSTIAL